MSLSALDDKVSKYQPYPVHLLDALKTLKYSPKQIQRSKAIHEDKTSSTGGRLGLNFDHKATREKSERVPDVFRKRKPLKHSVMPLGRTRNQKKLQNLELIPTLRKLDLETEKERELERVMKNLKLTKPANHRAATTSSKNKESTAADRGGMDFTSSLIEGHNLTLKQLREFWNEMPSFLSVRAANLKRKYGIFEKDSNDIDDISIEIVSKWNQPTGTLLPRIEIKTTGHLNVIPEETH